MGNDQFQYDVVYHVAVMNHWRDVVQEQMALLGGNRNWKSLTVSVGSDAEGPAEQAADLIRGIVGLREVRFFRLPLGMYEHGAMDLVDEVAGRGLAVLYFHAKAVSYTPPHAAFEDWRRYVNRLVAEADRWAEFLARSEFDACGPMKLVDGDRGFTYFAGNFWMAKAEYLKGLGRYREFAASGAGSLEHMDRHLAEMAVDRGKRMRGYAIDGTLLSPLTVWWHLENWRRDGPPVGARV